MLPSSAWCQPQHLLPHIGRLLIVPRVPACRIRVYHFYLPVFFYIEQQLAAHAAGRESEELPLRPLVLGISAPQARSP